MSRQTPPPTGKRSNRKEECRGRKRRIQKNPEERTELREKDCGRTQRTCPSSSAPRSRPPTEVSTALRLVSRPCLGFLPLPSASLLPTSPPHTQHFLHHQLRSGTLPGSGTRPILKENRRPPRSCADSACIPIYLV